MTLSSLQHIIDRLYCFRVLLFLHTVRVKKMYKIVEEIQNSAMNGLKKPMYYNLDTNYK